MKCWYIPTVCVLQYVEYFAILNFFVASSLMFGEF